MSQPTLRQRIGQAGESLDWNWLLEVARRHHVLPLVAYTLIGCCADVLPPALLEHLQTHTVAVRLRNTYMSRELLGLLEVFESAGIVAIPFKGPVLAASLYGDLGLRQFSDLDLLIAASDVPQAKDLLVRRGYALDPPLQGQQRASVLGLTGAREAAYLRSRSEHHFVRASDSMTVDLHLALADSYIRFPLTFDDLLRRSQWVPFEGTRVRSLSPEDTLLMLGLNGAKDGWERLQRTCDVAALLHACPELDHAGVLKRAKRLGALRLLRVSLRLAHDLVGAVLPTFVSDDVDSDAAADALARQVRAQLGNSRARPPVLSWAYARSYVRTRERLRDRLWFYLDLAFRPGVADWCILPLPAALAWLYYLIRPARLAYACSTVSWRSIRAIWRKSRPA